MEDGTWNKAYCFVFITCTMGSVGEYKGVVNRQTGDPCLQGGGETMPARQAIYRYKKIKEEHTRRWVSGKSLILKFLF